MFSVGREQDRKRKNNASAVRGSRLYVYYGQRGSAASFHGYFHCPAGQLDVRLGLLLQVVLIFLWSSLANDAFGKNMEEYIEQRFGDRPFYSCQPQR